MKYFSFLFISVFLFSCGSEQAPTQTQEEPKAAIDSTEKVPIDEEIVTEKDEPEIKVDQERLLENLFRFRTEQDLADYYGQENISRDFGYSNGGTIKHPVTLLFPGSDKELTVKWRNGDSTLANPFDIEFVSTFSPYWTTFEGVQVGVSLKELEELNDSTFWFYGFEWDFGGLSQFESGKLALLSTRMGLRLKAPEGYSDTDLLPLIGDKRFNSSNKYAQKLNPVVEFIRLVKG